MTQAIRLIAAALLLTGCPFLGEARYQRDIRDFDGDQVDGTRFGGDDCKDNDPSVQSCDADGDGHLSLAAGGDDCDDSDPRVFPGADELCNEMDDDCDGAIDDADTEVVGAPVWYADDDGDGYGSPDEAVAACVAPSNHVDDDRDCDDDRADVHPGAVEFCDAADRDCNGDPIANAVDPVDWFADGDGDGFGVGAAVTLACVGPGGTADNADDCDDTEALAFPGAVEVWYDGIDSDCDGASDFDQDGDGADRMPEGGDCDDLNPARFPSAVEICNGGVDDDCNGVADNDDGGTDPVGQWTYHLDADSDGFGSDLIVGLYCPNTEPPGWLLIGGDCNDSLDSVLPGGTEVCDTLDNDCDGVVDDGAIGMLTFYIDADGDGIGGPVTQSACAAGPGFSATTGDCNDADPLTYPGAPEICGDVVRQDCSALSVDDCDSDGYADVAAGGTDCDDTRADVNPAASEICDGLDNDCDTLVDSADPDVDLATAPAWYVDADGDGYGSIVLAAPIQCDQFPGAAPNTDDCDDGNPNTYPGAVERCDGQDNSCDGAIDELPVLDPPSYYYDADGDGFGNPALVSVQGCDPPSPSWVADNTDCQDGFASVNPLALEVCDGLDNDCDLLVDDADPGAAVSVWYLDDDGDGYGQTGSALQQCAQPMGYAALPGDCNDFDAATNPGASEVCDGGVDNDCDGLGDDSDPDLNFAVTWFLDADNDGFGDPANVSVQCAQPAGWVNNDGDCDDSQASISPAAIELCDTVDNDCDGLTDDADPGVVGASYWFADSDGDAWGDVNGATQACSQPPGLLPTAGDCDDADATVFPGAPEVCDGVDNDCDTLVDAADGNAVLTLWFADTDGDGSGDPLNTLADCSDPGAGYVPTGQDCNDADPLIFPGAPEICNYRDDDCDGLVDDADPGVGGLITWHLDNDNDGYGDALTTQDGCLPAPGFVLNNTDCDDTNALAHPGMVVEFCNGFDDNCNGLLDEADPMAIDAEAYLPDLDGDGYGDWVGVPVLACVQPPDTSPQAGDCDDTNPTVYESAPEVCDGVDNDCDGQVDDDDGDLTGGSPYFEDQDGDGFGDPFAQRPLCGPLAGWVVDNTDCDPFNPGAYPGATEVCDGYDNDCGGDGEAGAVDGFVFYRDADGDSFGDLGSTAMFCGPQVGWSFDGSDCNDSDPAIHPAVDEVCDGVDNDCDGDLDDADPSLTDGSFYYPDQDFDGFGDEVGKVYACAQPPLFITVGGDCKDTSAAVFPGAPEVCDGTDNDCDTLIDLDDPGVTDATVLFWDGDADGYGDPVVSALQCGTPLGWVVDNTDCDPSRQDVNPGAIEVCDGDVDNDCNGVADDADGGVVDQVTQYADQDFDGFGDAADFIASCLIDSARVLDGSDCNDASPGVNPAATERCDGFDNDCDGAVDDADPSVVDAITFYADGDMDGYGDAAVPFQACAISPGLSAIPGDCNDGDNTLYPGQTITVAPVGTTYTTIQGAIVAACEDGLIRVTPGVYPEQLDLLGKRLTVAGSQPGNRPILDAPITPAITVATGEPVGTAVESLIVRSSAGGAADGGGAWVSNGASVAFRDVDFEGLVVGGNGGGAAVSNGSAEFEGCRFAYNSAQSAGGLLVEAGTALLIDSDFELNATTLGDGGAIRVVNGQLTVAGGIYDSNSAATAGGAIAGSGVLTRVNVFDVWLKDSGSSTGGSVDVVDVFEVNLTRVHADGSGGINVFSIGTPFQLGLFDSDLVASTQTGISVGGTNLTVDLRNVAVLGAAGAGMNTGDAVVAVRNATFLGNALAGLELGAGGFGDVRNNLAGGNGLDDIVDGGFAGAIDWNLVDDPILAAALGGNNGNGNPLLLTWHANLDPRLWDVHHSTVGAAWDGGDPSMFDGDGSRVDVGRHGGPDLDMSWYLDDGDGLPDGWELQHFGDLGHSGTEDDDADGLDTTQELGFGCDPNNADTDGDGSNDLVDGDPLDPLTP